MLTGRFAGGGIIGCCSAYYLTRHPAFDSSKHNVTILEASEIAGGASGKAGGLLALWAFPSSIVPLSYKLHEELAKEHGGKERWGYREVNCGQLIAEAKAKPVARGDPEAVSLEKRSDKVISALKAAGIPDDLDWFDPEVLKAYEDMGGPGMTAQVHPYLFTTAMAQLAEEKGAKVVLGSATDINWSSAGVSGVTYKDKTTGDTKTLDATDVIVSAGPWSRRVFQPAPVEALRAHSVVVRPTRPVSAYTLFTNIALPASGSGASRNREKVVSPEVYARPDDTIYACGEGDQLVPLPDSTADVEVDQSRCQDIVDSIGAISTELRDGQEVSRQACYLPNVSGSRGGPLIGNAGIKGLYLATGHTCWGIQNAPGTGKLMSEFLFDGKAKSANIGSLDPSKSMKVPAQNG